MKENVRDEVISYFGKHHGPVEPLAQVEIVPSTWPPISVHAIKSGVGRDYLTLFTTGMSDEPMEVPEGNDDFRYAELFIQLPPGWRFELDHPEIPWILEWLRRVPGFIHGEKTWLGGPFTLFANSEPPEPLAEHVPFTTLLMIAKENFTASDGRIVQLYHLTPIYTVERDLEKRCGLAALMRAFDRENVSFVVDLNRKPATHRPPWFGPPLNIVGCLSIIAAPILLVLWIWFPGMGWASLASFVVGVFIVFIIARFTDW